MYCTVLFIIDIIQRRTDKVVTPLHKSIQMSPQKPKRQSEEQYFAGPVEDIQTTQHFPGIRKRIVTFAQNIGTHAAYVIAYVNIPIDLANRRVEYLLIRTIQLVAHLLKSFVPKVPVFCCIILQ